MKTPTEKIKATLADLEAKLKETAPYQDPYTLGMVHGLRLALHAVEEQECRGMRDIGKHIWGAITYNMTTNKTGIACMYCEEPKPEDQAEGLRRLADPDHP